MEHIRYIARQRARFKGLSGPVNIPWGAALENEGGFLMWRGEQLCAATSQNAFDFFSHDDDGQGRERGALVTAILACLQPQGPEDDCQARWDKVWGDTMCQQYRRSEHEDHWIWSYDFYNAPTVDLWHIARLVGAKPKYK